MYCHTKIKIGDNSTTDITVNYSKFLNTLNLYYHCLCDQQFS